MRRNPEKTPWPGPICGFLNPEHTAASGLERNRTMGKFILTCRCGQRMQVPRSAVGRLGQCPACGERIQITSDLLSPRQSSRRGPLVRGASFRDEASTSGAREEDKQRFGKAVDLFYTRRYAEALSLFDALARDYPDNPEIESGRRECLRQMRRYSLGNENEPNALPAPDSLGLDAIKRVIHEKLSTSTSDEVQLRAAELALRVLEIEARRTASTPVEPDACTSSNNDHADMRTDNETAPREFMEEESFS